MDDNDTDPYIKIVDAFGIIILYLLAILLPTVIVSQVGLWQGWW